MTSRLTPLIILLAIGCGGEGTSGPAAVASVTLSPALNSLQIGQSATLTANPKDAGGNPLSGRAAAWSSSNAAVATVNSGGTVAALSNGTTVVTATVESKTGQLTITVSSGGVDCTASVPVTLAPGEARVLSSAERAALCVPGGTSGAEYTLVPMDLSATRAPATVTLTASNTVAASTPLAAVRAAGTEIDRISRRSVSGMSSIAGSMPRNYAFEQNLRARGRAELRALRANARGPRVIRSSANDAVAVAGVPASIKDLPSSPAVGSLINLNASSSSFCTTPLTRTGRIVAVTAAAIVVEDTTAPPGGFSNAEYLSIATTFDTLLYALDTTAFGAPYDMDGNGRVLMFFTTAVNQQTSANATSVIGGFFWERDLIPRTANAIVPASCATSNEGEMFYLPVVDAANRYNPWFNNKQTLLAEINATAVHEFQHLINSSRRIYVTPEVVEEEEGWLNEGMSHIAEELLYLRVAGLPSRADLNFAVSSGGSTSSPQYAALTNYQADNLARFNSHLRAVESTSSYLDNDDLETRGATWALLRWALDHSPLPNSSHLRALVNAPTQGIPNFDNVFAGVGGLAGAVRSATVAHYTDNYTPGISAQYSHLSWNFRDWLPHFTSNNNAYPLATRSLLSGVTTPISLVAGGSSFARFRVNAGVTAGISVAQGGAAGPADLQFVLVRTQ